MIPIHKAGPENIRDNYRPISLIAIIGKIYDSLLNDQLMNHCITYSLLGDRNYGYRPASTTVLCLQAIFNRVQTSIRAGRKVAVIFLDLSKAYDTIEHKKLVDKLSKQFNFDGKTTRFLESYMKNRRQKTDTRHTQSDEKEITHGIPQGGVLSTTLFVLYTNDLDEQIEKSRANRRREEENEQGGVYAYADDASTIVETTTIPGLEKEVNETVKDLVRYYANLTLVPNMNKTHVQCFNRNTKIHVEIDGIIIQNTNKVNLLGVTLTNNLKHIATANKCRSKIMPLLRQMRYAKAYLTSSQLLTIYKTQVLPKLTYAITIWGSDKENPTYLQPLTKTLKAFARIIAKKGKSAHTEPIRKEYKLLTLRSLYIQQVCMEMYPYIRKKLKVAPPEHQHHYHGSQIHEHQTRTAARQLVFVPQPVTRNRKLPTQALAPLNSNYAKIWNTLPENLRLNDEDNRRSFRLTLNDYLLNQQT